MHQVEQFIITDVDEDGQSTTRLIDICSACDEAFEDAESQLNSVCEAYAGPDVNIPKKLKLPYESWKDKHAPKAWRVLDLTEQSITFIEPEWPTGVDAIWTAEEWHTLYQDEEYTNGSDNKPLWNADSYKDARWESSVYLSKARKQYHMTKLSVQAHQLVKLRKENEELTTRLKEAVRIYRLNRAEIKHLHKVYHELRINTLLVKT